MAIERTGRISGGFGGSRRGSSGPKIGCSGCSLVTVGVCHLSREARWVGKDSNPRLSPPCRSPAMDHLVLCASHPPGQTARRPDRYRSSRESSWSRSGRCCHSTTCQHRTVEARPGQTRLAMSRPRSRLRDLIQTPLADRPGSQFGSARPHPRGGRDVRSPRRRYAQPGQLLRGYPSVGEGFTNPSPTPIRLRGCPSLTSCLSLPVAFLWRS